mmetsp:Transcript_15985/g.31606  ORF Transcript_15985/g.31606 Transcript_15985/m.31606 type:complete len:221 (+) Transcript_15985:348-1010(+)
MAGQHHPPPGRRAHGELKLLLHLCRAVSSTLQGVLLLVIQLLLPVHNPLSRVLHRGPLAAGILCVHCGEEHTDRHPQRRRPVLLTIEKKHHVSDGAVSSDGGDVPPPPVIVAETCATVVCGKKVSGSFHSTFNYLAQAGGAPHDAIGVLVIRGREARYVPRELLKRDAPRIFAYPLHRHDAFSALCLPVILPEVPVLIPKGVCRHGFGGEVEGVEDCDES